MKRRSGEAVAAQHRKAGPMHHKIAPRGGARNTHTDYLNEDATAMPKLITEATFQFPNLLQINGELRDYGNGEVTVTVSVIFRVEGSKWRLDVDLDTDRDAVVSRTWYRGFTSQRISEQEASAEIDEAHYQAMQRVVCAMTGMAVLWRVSQRNYSRK